MRRMHLVKVLVAILLVVGLLVPSAATASSSTAVATLIPYRKGNVWGFCDQNKKMVIPAVYEGASRFSEGLARVELKGKYGYINTQGKMVTPIIYDQVYDFSDNDGGLAEVELKGKWGYINTQGKMVTPIIYDEIDSFSNGLAPVKLKGKWGYINNKGKMVIPAVYDQTYGFFDGLACVVLNSKWGYIDTKGKMVIPAIYDIASPLFTDGVSEVWLNNKMGYIDTKGTQYWEKNVTPKKPAPAAKNWQQVTEFTGDSTKTTQPFTIVSNEWRIAWTATPGTYGDGNFVIYLYSADGNIVSVAANVIGEGGDTSYVYTSGTYYLSIIAIENYDIVIEQYN